MRKKLLLLLLSLSGLSSCLGVYHFVPELKTWTEAQQHCRSMGGDLATVGSAEDNDKLMAEMKRHEDNAIFDNQADSVWIGLFDDVSAWKWSLNNQDTDFTHWGSQEPNFNNARENCTVMENGGFWNDKECDLEYASICYDDEAFPKYIYVGTKMTWPVAQEYCRAQHTDLASVKDLTENGLISLKLLASLGSEAWIGLHRQPWAHWSDQTVTNFTYWNENQPDNFENEQYCVSATVTTGKWDDESCTMIHPFVCQKVTLPSAKRTFKLKIHTEADMKDPAVQHQILQQLHAKLEKKGLSDFKLRWMLKDGQIFHEEQEGEN